MEWHSLVYPALLVAGFLLKAVLEKLTREITAPEISHALDSALARFKNDLIKELNGTYTRSGGSNLTGAEIGRRLHALEQQRNRA